MTSVSMRTRLKTRFVGSAADIRSRAGIYLKSIGLTLTLWEALGLLPWPVSPPGREALASAQATLSTVALPVLLTIVQLGWRSSPLPVSWALAQKLLAIDRICLSLAGLAVLLIIPDPYLGLSIILVTLILLGDMYREAVRLDEATITEQALQSLIEGIKRLVRRDPIWALGQLGRVADALAEASVHRRSAGVWLVLEGFRQAVLAVLPAMAEPGRIQLVLNNRSICWWFAGQFSRLMAIAKRNQVYEISPDFDLKLVRIPVEMVEKSILGPADPPAGNKQLLVQLGLAAVLAAFGEADDRQALYLGQKLGEDLRNLAIQAQEVWRKEILAWWECLLAQCLWKDRWEAFRLLLYDFTNQPVLIDANGWHQRWLTLIALSIVRFGTDPHKFEQYRKIFPLPQANDPVTALVQAADDTLAALERLWSHLPELSAEVDLPDLRTARAQAVLLAGVLLGGPLPAYGAALRRHAPTVYEEIRAEFARLKANPPAWTHAFQDGMEQWASVFGEASG